VWGDSLAQVNPGNRNLKVPLGIDDMPHQAEPEGPLLALFAGLYEPELAAVVSARGGLVSWQSLLESPFLYVPHDAVVPGALEVGDLNDIVPALAPQPVWISGVVDGLNRQVNQEQIDHIYAEARNHYQATQANQRLKLHAGEQNFVDKIIPWLVDTLHR
jgi:hypothetical protein